MPPTKKKTAKKAQIGDIVEIPTPSGLAYVQYIYDNGDNGDLVRILPGLYQKRPADLLALSRDKEIYFTFYLMEYAIRKGLAKVVSHESVPEWAQTPPIMRHAAAFGVDWGVPTKWRLISAASRLTWSELLKAPLLTQLTPEQKKISIHQIRPHAAMVKELARGWTPERAEEIFLQDKAEQAAAETGANTQRENAAVEKPMRHFLYFPTKTKAEGASECLLREGFNVEVMEGAEENWLALATKMPPSTGGEMDKLRDDLETLALQFGGNYDGWELSVESVSGRIRP